jgi:hypothetical protein
LSGLPTVAAEADSIKVLQICLDVIIGEGDRQPRIDDIFLCEAT